MEQQSNSDIFNEILENNINFKILLNKLKEEATTSSGKEQIFVQLSLLSEILEKKMEMSKKKMSQNNPEFELLKSDTKNVLQKYKIIKFIKENDSQEKLEDNKFIDDLDSNLLEEKSLQNIEEIPFDRDQDFQDIVVSLHNLNRMSKETMELVLQNQEKLDLIEVDTQKTLKQTGQVVKEMKVAANEAVKRRKNYLKMIFAAIGGLVGLQAGPVGVVGGGVVGGCVGGVASLGLNPLQSKIKKIEDKH